MLQSFANLNALFEVALMLLFFVFWPVLAIYVVGRILRDLRRIAKSLERISGEPQPVFRVRPVMKPSPRPAEPDSLIPSQFGFDH